MSQCPPSRASFLPTSPQHHPKSHRLLIRCSHAPLQFARNRRSLCLLARERLEHPYVFLRPRPQLRLLRHSLSPCTNVVTESATIIMQNAQACGQPPTATSDQTTLCPFVKSGELSHRN